MTYVLGFSFPLRDTIMSECSQNDVRYIKLKYYSKKDLLIGYLKYFLFFKSHINVIGHEVYNQLCDIKSDDKVIIWGGGECAPLQMAILDALSFRKVNNYVFYWDIVNEKKYKLTKKINKYFTYYTYDRGDIAKFGFKYKEQLTYDVIPFMKGNNPVVDLYFCGKDKGRYKKLYEIMSFCDKKGFSYNFNCLRDDTSPTEMSSAMNTTELISFEDNILNMEKSKCVVELLGKGHIGISLRALEALMCKRKLITDCSDIVNEKFYDRKNIFILGVDEDFESFIKTPFDSSIDYDFSPYLINDWLNSFRK